MLLSKCEVCDSKTSKFIKAQKTIGLLNGLTKKTTLTNISLVGPRLF